MYLFLLYLFIPSTGATIGRVVGKELFVMFCIMLFAVASQLLHALNIGEDRVAALLF